MDDVSDGSDGGLECSEMRRGESPGPDHMGFVERERIKKSTICRG